jgi:acetyl-CoA C-acetyltransferase
MGSANAWIAGSYQSDFARNYAREGLEISDMIAEAVAGTLEDARVGPEDVEAIHVGNAFGQLFTGQGQLGAMPATVEPRLWGKPAARHEAACASGSVAILAATAEIEAGRYDCVLVLAVEQERNVPGKDAPKHLGAAAWIGHEGQDATFMWPYMFSQLADEYDRRYGLDNQHLHAIAELNMRNAKANPLAQTRAWEFGPGGFAEDDHDNPIVEGRLRRTDCAQVTDGVAGVLLVSDRFRAARATTKPLPGSQAGDTARRACRCSPSWTAAAARNTSSRTSGTSSPTPSAAPRWKTCTRSTASRHTTASPCRSTWPSTTSASPSPARAGRRSRTATSSGTARSRSTRAAG